MKILCIQYGNPWSPFSHGGLSLASHEVLKRLAKKYSVTVYTGLIDKDKSTIVLDNVTYIQMSFGRNRWINRLSFSWMSFFYPLINFDVIVLIWDRYAPAFIFTKRIPVILEIHSDFINSPSKAPLLEPITRWLFKQSCKRYHYAITIATYLKDQLMSLNPNFKSIEVIYNGIEDSLLQTDITRKEEKYILFLGRLDIRVKGIDLLLRAYKQSYVKLPLVIAGDGPDKDEIKKQIAHLGLQEAVDLAGWADENLKRKLISESMVVVIPSRAEGWGLVAMEAAASGKPVIATDTPGLNEAVIDGKTGILVEPENIYQLSTAIKKISQDVNLRNQLASSSKDWAKNFTWDKSANLREDFFLHACYDWDSFK